MFTFVKNLKDRLKNKYSNADYELKYWNKTGLDKGTDFYKRYLEKFSLFREELFQSDKNISDFGCGPFSGILSYIEPKNGFPIDILADEYNSMAKSKYEIIKFDGKKTTLDNASLDMIFCCNAIDHTRHPKLIVNELRRLLKIGGELYLHVHLREEHEINRGHPLAWNENLFEELFQDGFQIEWQKVDPTDEVNGNQHRTLYSKLIKL